MSGTSLLQRVIAEHVSPGMHLHFSSSPSRSNAAVRELARVFRGTAPEFVISASGFHSTLHLLVRLGLGRAYWACFFGDNYPTPRPNALYRALAQSSPERISVLSLLSYVEALRAGALGHDYAVNRSLVGTDVGRDLERAERFLPLKRVPAVEGAELGLVKAIRPDITFVHAALGDEAGNVVVSAPTSEGFWAANAAQVGVIVTVERVVSSADLRPFRDAMPIARHRVLAVCEAPGGAHPQPLHVEPRFGVASYADDFEHYRLWRRLSTDDALFARFTTWVLDAEDGERGYAEFKHAVATGELTRKSTWSSPREHESRVETAEAALYLAAARVIQEKVQTRGYRVIIAGIGASFFASRLAKIWLERAGVHVDVIVETGLIGIPCDAEGHEFLLAEHNASRSARLSNVEDALGVLCNAGQRCLGVVGAAQVDVSGAINSTRSPEGDFLVGAGGASDIAVNCAEVVVTVRAEPARLVERAAYVTSRGERVSAVVTDRATFSRTGANTPWRLEAVALAGQASLDEAIASLRALCPWPFEASAAASTLATPARERADLAAILGKEAARA